MDDEMSKNIEDKTGKTHNPVLKRYQEKRLLSHTIKLQQKKEPL